MRLRAYLDIEATGLSRYSCDLTVIGIAIENGSAISVAQLIEPHKTEAKLPTTLQNTGELYTYVAPDLQCQILRRTILFPYPQVATRD